MSQPPRHLRVLRYMTEVDIFNHDHRAVLAAADKGVPRRRDAREQEEFELSPLTLAELHALKMGQPQLSELFAALAKNQVHSTTLGLPLGRPPGALEARCVRTPEELAELREAA